VPLAEPLAPLVAPQGPLKATPPTPLPPPPPPPGLQPPLPLPPFPSAKAGDAPTFKSASIAPIVRNRKDVEQRRSNLPDRARQVRANTESPNSMYCCFALEKPEGGNLVDIVEISIVYYLRQHHKTTDISMIPLSRTTISVRCHIY
jgi:hypothetical protein